MPISWTGRVGGLVKVGVCALVLLRSGICHATEAPFPARIGNAVVVLAGPWKFHPGDDAAWANPDFDDTGWGTIALTPPEGSYDPITGSSGFVPGWTARGYPGLNRYAWYRLSVKVESDGAGTEPSPLALTMPLNFDDGYEVFVNGRRVGAFGQLNSSSVLYYNSQPRAFPLPDDLRNGAMTIAIRFWMDPATVLSSPDVGGMHGPPMLGQLSAIDAMLRLEWDAVNRTQVGNLLSVGFLFLRPAWGSRCSGLTARSLPLLAGSWCAWWALVARRHSHAGLLHNAGWADDLGDFLTGCRARAVDPYFVDLVLGLLVRAGKHPGGLRALLVLFRISLLFASAWLRIRPPLYGTVIPAPACLRGWCP